MPLRDHFRPPVSDVRRWNGVFGGWPATLVREMFDTLPKGFQAEPSVQLASTAESKQDQYEVLVYDDEMRQRLVAAIEIVSPSNEDRPDTRRTFVGKVIGLLQQGVCVSLVDLVSDKEFNLYAELLTELGRADPTLPAPPPHLYAVSLRARKRPRKRLSLLDAWFYPMTVGQPLPTIPLWLSPTLRVDLPLEPSYQETCRLLRIA